MNRNIKYIYGDTEISLTQNEIEMYQNNLLRIRNDIFAVNAVERFSGEVRLIDFNSTTFQIDKFGNLEVNPAYIKDRNFTNDEIAFWIGHEVAHKSYFHLDTMDLLCVLANQNKSFLNQVSGCVLQHDELFRRALNRKFEFDADRLGRYLAKQAGYQDVADSAIFKLGTDVEYTAQLLKDDHPLPGERVSSLLSKENINFSQLEAKKDFIFLFDVIERNKENPSFDDIKDSLLLELKYVDYARKSMSSLNLYLLDNYKAIKDALLDVSIFKNRTLYNTLCFCEKDYHRVVEDTSNIIIYDSVREEYKNLEDKMKLFKRDLQIAKNPLKRTVLKVKRIFTKDSERASKDDFTL